MECACVVVCSVVVVIVTVVVGTVVLVADWVVVVVLVVVVTGFTSAGDKTIGVKESVFDWFFFNFLNWSTDEQTDKDLPWHRQCEAGQYPVAQLFWHHVSMFACPAHAPAAKQILEDLRWRESPEHGGPLHSSPSHWDRHHHRIKSELGEICFLQKTPRIFRAHINQWSLSLEMVKRTQTLKCDSFTLLFKFCVCFSLYFLQLSNVIYCNSLICFHVFNIHCFV